MLFEAAETQAKVDGLGDNMTKLMKKYFGSDAEKKQIVAQEKRETTMRLPVQD